MTKGEVIQLAEARYMTLPKKACDALTKYKEAMK